MQADNYTRCPACHPRLAFCSRSDAAELGTAVIRRGGESLTYHPRGIVGAGGGCYASGLSAGGANEPSAACKFTIPAGSFPALPRAVRQSPAARSLFNRKESTMLVLSRRKDERILIGDDIVITVCRINGDRVRVGVEAPDSVPVLRAELVEREEKASQ